MEELSVEIKDPLIGTVINGRYEIQRLAETDELSKLYSGYDSETSSMVGIRVTETPMEHRRLHEWLGAAIMTRGRFAILAVGHFDRKRSYLVLSEAALTILRPKPGQFDDEDDYDDEGPCADSATESLTAAASADGEAANNGAATATPESKRPSNVLELFSQILKGQRQ